MDAAELAKTVEKWNQYCKDGNDPDFNFRGDFNAIEGGPYYLMAYKPAVHYTMGGLHINTDAQVLDDADAPFPACTPPARWPATRWARTAWLLLDVRHLHVRTHRRQERRSVLGIAYQPLRPCASRSGPSLPGRALSPGAAFFRYNILNEIASSSQEHGRGQHGPASRFRHQQGVWKRRPRDRRAPCQRAGHCVLR